MRGRWLLMVEASTWLSFGVAALLLLILWRFLPFLKQPKAAQPSESQPVGPQPQIKRVPPPPEQERHCSAVKADAQIAAEAMLAAYDRGAREQVIEQLDQLSRIFNEQQSAGHKGHVALTEFCNVLVHTDALDTVHALQEDSDPRVAQTATALFQGVVPRIWSS